MHQDELNRQKRKMAADMALIARRKLRDMRRASARRRTYHLPKAARILRSLLAEAGEKSAAVGGKKESGAGRESRRRSRYS